MAPPEPTEENANRLVQVLKDNDRSGDGTISQGELGNILRALDDPSYWAEERVAALFQSAGGAAGARIKYEVLVQSLCAGRGVDWDEVRRDLLRVMDSPDWDDGSYAPLLIRLAWHSAGTYSKEDSTGGSNGATMRYDLEAGDPENVGLDFARTYLEPVKAKHPGISYADLWVLASYVAIEHTAGPRIPFIGGRTDAPAEKAIAPGRLPGAERGVEGEGLDLDSEGRVRGWEATARHVREVFGRMGFGDREVVALLCGGHVYGRCHPDKSGYAGAWVENPTRFSNEYAADLVGDKWIAVMSDTVMPDGGAVPEEVRPAPGKRQYIDLTKYEGEAEEKPPAPDVADFPPGRYKCISDWVNVRETPAVDSPILGRINRDQEVALLSVKIFGTACRGCMERGGWVSVRGSGGKTLFERVGDLDAGALAGRYRVVVGDGAPVFASAAAAPEEPVGRAAGGEEFCAEEVRFGEEGGSPGAVFGLRGEGRWVLLFSPTRGSLAELVVEGYNEKPRRPIKAQSGHQMMLVADMVMLWDPDFRVHLEQYAEDTDLLKADFGAAYKRLTELGCPWSADGGVRGAAAALGCPVLAGH